VLLGGSQAGTVTRQVARSVRKPRVSVFTAQGWNLGMAPPRTHASIFDILFELTSSKHKKTTSACLQAWQTLFSITLSVRIFCFGTHLNASVCT
jgi:hypothetical protein